jgi:hypothetical protein
LLTGDVLDVQSSIGRSGQSNTGTDDVLFTSERPLRITASNVVGHNLIARIDDQQMARKDCATSDTLLVDREIEPFNGYGARRNTCCERHIFLLVLSVDRLQLATGLA